MALRIPKAFAFQSKIREDEYVNLTLEENKIVIEPEKEKKYSFLAIFCPIISQEKGYPFEVMIPDNLEISGLILSDQIKSLDWKTRKSKFICKLPKVALKETLNKINALLNPYSGN